MQLVHTYTCLFVLLSLLLAVHCSHPCGFRTVRTPRGTSVQCTCQGQHSTTVAFPASTGVDTACIDACIKRDQLIAGGCAAQSAAPFQTAATNARSRCCSSCGGNLVGGVCEQNFLDSRPLFMGPGCNSKVRELSSGVSFACRCSGEQLTEVEFPISSGVGRLCVDSCAEQLLRDVCTPGIGQRDFFGIYRSLFQGCCVQQCGGVALDGGFTCGYRV